MIPLTLDKEAAKDHELKNITPERAQITAYGEATILVMGQVLIYFECGNHHYIIRMQTGEQHQHSPTLQRKACLEMKIIA